MKRRGSDTFLEIGPDSLPSITGQMARPSRKRGVSRGPQRQSQTARPWTSQTREATPSVPQASALRAQPLSQCNIGVHTHDTFWRALKEQLREVFLNSGGYARVQLQGFVAMATRSGLAQFIKLASRIRVIDQPM